MYNFSVSSVDAILSSPAPPYCSGVPPLIKPSAPAFFTSSGMSPGFLFSRSLAKGSTSLRINSSAVCPINFWSSVKSAGVKMSFGAADSSRKLPPLAAGLLTTEVAMSAPCGRKNGESRCRYCSVDVHCTPLDQGSQRTGGTERGYPPPGLHRCIKRKALQSRFSQMYQTKEVTKRVCVSMYHTQRVM